MLYPVPRREADVEEKYNRQLLKTWIMEKKCSNMCFKYAGLYCDCASQSPEGNHLLIWTGMRLCFSTSSEEEDELSEFSARPRCSCHELVLNEFSYCLWATEWGNRTKTILPQLRVTCNLSQFKFDMFPGKAVFLQHKIMQFLIDISICIFPRSKWGHVSSVIILLCSRLSALVHKYPAFRCSVYSVQIHAIFEILERNRNLIFYIYTHTHIYINQNTWSS